MPLPTALVGESVFIHNARAAVPILVWCAQNRTPITYGRLSKLIVERNLGTFIPPVAYANVCDAVGRATIETGSKLGGAIPPLNALVVNATSGMPGTGCDYYIENYVAPEHQPVKLDTEDRKAVIEELHEQIFDYDGWDTLLEEYGFEAAEPIPDLAKGAVAVPLSFGQGWSGEGESDAHNELKEYVRQHPELVGLPKAAAPGNTEYIFPSGDRADVLFRHAQKAVAVEVKSKISNDADLCRGVFQCVKYRALVRAEQKAAAMAPTGKAVLVCDGHLPIDIRKLAKRLGIPFRDEIGGH